MIAIKRIPYRDFIITLKELGKNCWEASVYDETIRYDHGVICDGEEYKVTVVEARKYIDEILREAY